MEVPAFGSACESWELGLVQVVAAGILGGLLGYPPMIGGLDTVGRARVGGGEGLEAYGRGAPPARIFERSLVKLPQFGPVQVSSVRRPQGGGLQAFSIRNGPW
jgi:hypothetical protein